MPTKTALKIWLINKHTTITKTIYEPIFLKAGITNIIKVAKTVENKNVSNNISFAFCILVY